MQSPSADETADRPPEATTTDNGENIDTTLNTTIDASSCTNGRGTPDTGAMSEVRKAATAALLAPLVMVHFIVIILPLRIAHAATVDNSHPNHVELADRAGGPPQEVGAMPDLVSGVTGRPGRGDEEEEHKSKSNSDPAPARGYNPPEGHAHISSIVPPGDVTPGNSDFGTVVETSEILEGGADGLPAAIRRHLARPELDIRR